jgi:hypothetical protein
LRVIGGFAPEMKTYLYDLGKLRVAGPADQRPGAFQQRPIAFMAEEKSWQVHVV